MQLLTPKLWSAARVGQLRRMKKLSRRKLSAGNGLWDRLFLGVSPTGFLMTDGSVIFPDHNRVLRSLPREFLGASCPFHAPLHGSAAPPPATDRFVRHPGNYLQHLAQGLGGGAFRPQRPSREDGGAGHLAGLGAAYLPGHPTRRRPTAGCLFQLAAPRRRTDAVHGQ